MEYFDDMPTKKNRRARLLLVLALVLAIAVFAACFITFGHSAAPAATPDPAALSGASLSELQTGDGLLVCFLDVGQGDCAFLRAPDGTTILVDAGPVGSFQTIRAFLDALGVTRIDYAVVSHLHADHIGSMAEILTHYEVGAFYMPPYDSETSLYADLLAALDAYSVPVSTVSAGVNTLLAFSDTLEVRVLSPYDVTYSDENDTSLMLRFKYGETAVLFTGDAGETAERLAVKAQKDIFLRADLLKAGHHGSKYSTSERFLSAVKPRCAVISVGADNTYGLPSYVLLNRLAAHGITVYRTDQDGTVRFLLDGTDVRVIE